MMDLHQIIRELNLKAWSLPDHDHGDLQSGFSGDLLSHVMAFSRPGQIWLTCLAHRNIVAVASIKELPVIILVNQEGDLDTELIHLAQEQGVALLSSDRGSFELAGLLTQLFQK